MFSATGMNCHEQSLIDVFFVSLSSCAALFHPNASRIFPERVQSEEALHVGSRIAAQLGDHLDG
jgi:hypothetical protein